MRLKRSLVTERHNFVADHPFLYCLVSKLVLEDTDDVSKLLFFGRVVKPPETDGSSSHTHSELWIAQYFVFVGFIVWVYCNQNKGFYFVLLVPVLIWTHCSFILFMCGCDFLKLSFLVSWQQLPSSIKKLRYLLNVYF